MGTPGDAAHATRNFVSVHFGHQQVAEHEARGVLANLLELAGRLLPRPPWRRDGSGAPALVRGDRHGLQRPERRRLPGTSVTLPRISTRCHRRDGVRERSARRCCHRHRRSEPHAVRPGGPARCPDVFHVFHAATGGPPGLGGLWSTYEPRAIVRASPGAGPGTRVLEGSTPRDTRSFGARRANPKNPDAGERDSTGARS